MGLSVVIVNWNSAAYAVEAIKSISATIGDLDYEILVVDNASTDDSREVLGHPLPRTTVIHSPVNLGFARANNLAVREAAGRCILFLNPDTRVLEGAIGRMLAAIESSADVGVVGARLLNSDLTLQLSCVRPFPTIANQVFDAQWLRRRTPTLSSWRRAAMLANPRSRLVDVPAVSGACLMIRCGLFRRLGGFSEDYFMYAEDTDLCHQAWRSGLRVCHVPSARVIHAAGGSSRMQADDGFVAVLQRESTYRFLAKTRGPRYAWRYRRAIQTAAVARILVLQTILLPTHRPHMHASLRKWRRILRWTRGLEPWAERLSASTTLSVAS
jgi:GT2 family glycosyltransferase